MLLQSGPEESGFFRKVASRLKKVESKQVAQIAHLTAKWGHFVSILILKRLVSGGNAGIS